MKPRQPEHTPQKHFLEPELRDIINPRHELVVLSQRIGWATCEAHFGELYHQSNGRPGLPIRLLVGLHFIKHLYKLSDEQCVARWVENPYYQYFCGEQYFQHRLPLDPTSMTRFRKRLGEDGVNELLKLTIQAGLDTGTIQPESLKLVVADTTVMEKAVAYPTDTRLLAKAREYLVAQAKVHGVALRQTYAKEFRTLAFKASGYAHARQMNRLRNVQRKMRHRIGRLMRELMRKIPAEAAQAGLLSVLQRAGQAMRQSMDPKAKDKLYAFHAPEVACIRKGKARNPNEFGCKVSVVTTANEYFVLACHALPGNPYDGHTLYGSLIKTTANTGVIPRSVLVDRGYKSAERRTDVTHVHITGRKTGRGKAHERQSRRNGIEAIIGHMKNEGHLGRNYLKGELGDRINAVLCGVGQNLRLILQKLRELLFVLRKDHSTGLIRAVWQIFFALSARLGTGSKLCRGIVA